MMFSSTIIGLKLLPTTTLHHQHTGQMMISVLLRLRHSSPILGEFPNLAAYVARGEARPAYKRAFAAQLAVFTERAAKE